MAIISRTQWKKYTFIYNIIRSRHKLISKSENGVRVKFDTKCLNSGLLRRKCYCTLNPHYDLVEVRCHKYLYCKPCSTYRRNKWYWNCINRFKKLDPQPKQINLWTLGSNLHESELNSFKQHWTKFRKRMALYSKRKGFRYEPLFYVYELTKGSNTSRRIHIHLVVDGFLDQGIVLDQWRDKGRRYLNVNFSKRKGMSPSRAFGYCVKYMTKEFNGQIARGYYLGRLLKSKIDHYSVKYVAQTAGQNFRYEKKIYVKTIPDELKTKCSEGEFYKGNEIEVVPYDPRKKFDTGQKTLQDGRTFELHNPYIDYFKNKRRAVSRVFTSDEGTSSLNDY